MGSASKIFNPTSVSPDVFFLNFMLDSLYLFHCLNWIMKEYRLFISVLYLIFKVKLCISLSILEMRVGELIKPNLLVFKVIISVLRNP